MKKMIGNCFISNNLLIIIFISLILILLFKYLKNIENFHGIEYINFGYPSRIYEPTRNMSYNLRGDPYIIPKKMYPFMGSNIGPFYYRKPLYLLI
jgi:hypothetical protein